MIGGSRSRFGVPPANRRPFRSELSLKGWRRARELAKARDGYRCQVCGAPEVKTLTRNGRMVTNLQVGHRIPAERYPGSHDDPSNLWTLCRGCNASQGNRTPEEWRAAASGRLVRLGLVELNRPPSQTITRDYTRRPPALSGDYTRRDRP